MKRFKKQFFVYPAEMMLALYLTVLGYMIPEIQKTFGLSNTAVGLFSTLQSLGLFAALILCFCLFSGLNKTHIISMSAIALATCMILLGFNRIAIILYILFFFIGMLNAIMDTLSNALIVDMSGNKAKIYLGLLHALWAAAGVIGPYFAIMLGGDYTTAFVGLGILLVVSAIIFSLGLNRRMRKPLVQAQHNIGGLRKLLRLLKKPGMPIIVLLGFFNCFMQMSFIYFISAYASSLGIILGGGALALSLLVGGFLVGRILYSGFAHKFPTIKLMLILSAMTLCSFTIMLFSQNAVLIFALIFVGGLGISVTVPGLVVEACVIVPEDTAAASSLVFFGIGVGAFFGPLIVGAIGDAAGLQSGLLAATAMLIPFIALAAYLEKRFESKRRQES